MASWACSELPEVRTLGAKEQAQGEAGLVVRLSSCSTTSSPRASSASTSAISTPAIGVRSAPSTPLNSDNSEGEEACSEDGQWRANRFCLGGSFSFPQGQVVTVRRTFIHAEQEDSEGDATDPQEPFTSRRRKRAQSLPVSFQVYRLPKIEFDVVIADAPVPEQPAILTGFDIGFGVTGNSATQEACWWNTAQLALQSEPPQSDMSSLAYYPKMFAPHAPEFAMPMSSLPFEPAAVGAPLPPPPVRPPGIITESVQEHGTSSLPPPPLFSPMVQATRILLDECLLPESPVACHDYGLSCDGSAATAFSAANGFEEQWLAACEPWGEDLTQGGHYSEALWWDQSLHAQHADLAQWQWRESPPGNAPEFQSLSHHQ